MRMGFRLAMAGVVFCLILAWGSGKEALAVITGESLIRVDEEVIIISPAEGTTIEPGAIAPPPLEPVEEYVPDELLVKFKPEVEIQAGVIPDWLAALGVVSIEEIFPGAPSSKETKLKKIRDLLKARRELIREYTQYIKINKFSFERLLEFLEKLRYLQKELKRVRRLDPEKEFVDLRNTWKLVFKEEVDILDMIKKLEPDERVIYAEKNLIFRALLVPDDPFFATSGSWGQPYDDLWGLKIAQLEQAWDLEVGPGVDVIVAVVDTGADRNHPDLLGNIWMNPDEAIGDANTDGCPGVCGVDDDGDGFTDEDSQNKQLGDPGYTNDLEDDDDENGYVDDINGWNFVANNNNPADGHGHGTHVAGTACAITNNGTGISGFSFQNRIKVLPLKGLNDAGGGTAFNLSKAIEYAADISYNKGIRVVINNSWGGFDLPPSDRNTIEGVINYAHEALRNCVIVASAGNDDRDTTGYVPADLENVITVSAFNPSDQKWVDSNFGPKIDVAAPGVDILSLRGIGTSMGDVVDDYHTRAEPQWHHRMCRDWRP